jgi:hypothetical protein
MNSKRGTDIVSYRGVDIASTMPWVDSVSVSVVTLVALSVLADLTDFATNFTGPDDDADATVIVLVVVGGEDEGRRVVGFDVVDTVNVSESAVSTVVATELVVSVDIIISSAFIVGVVVIIIISSLDSLLDNFY